MRIGMIGAGSFARRGPLPAIDLAPGVELEAVYDPVPAASRAAAADFGPRHVCSSMAELLALRSVDVVFIGTPPGSHVEVVGSVIDAGKHFICEKPVTLRSGDALRLAYRARAAGLVNAVDHEFRYDAGMLEMKARIESGFIGTVRNSLLSVILDLSVNPQYTALTYWNFNHCAAQGGGVLPQMGSHLLDLHLHLFGDLDPVGGYTATMVAQRPLPPASPGGRPGPLRAVEAEDSVALAGRLPGGAPAALSVSWVAPVMPDFRWTVHGDAGALRYDGNNGWFGGTLAAQRLGESAPSSVALANLPALDTEQARSRYQQQLISALIGDVQAVLGGERQHGSFATLETDAKVWRAIEGWRRCGEGPGHQ